MSDDSWLYELIDSLGCRELQGIEKSVCTDENWAALRFEPVGIVPDIFRKFICKCGGAVFYNEDFFVSAPILEHCPWGESVDFGVIYPLVKNYSRSLEANLKTYRTRIPAGSLVFTQDAGGNQLVLDVAGKFPGSVWFWDHEQRWFTHNIEAAAREVDAAGIDARRMDVHQIIRAWARLHEAEFDRPADYMGMYRIAPDFETFLKSLYKEPY